MNNNKQSILNKSTIFFTLFLSLFVIVGIGLATWGFVKLAKYNLAEQVEATVISTEYKNDRTAEIVFGFERNGGYTESKLHMTNIKTFPYFVGEKVSIHVNDFNEVQQFGSIEIIVLVSGFLFMLAGAGFMYFFVFKKKSFFNIAFEYENAMVTPESLTDNILKNEAIADELTKLPVNSVERKMGELKIWKNRFGARFKTFTIWENLFGLSLFVLPTIILSVYPLFIGKAITSGMIVSNIIFCFLTALIVLAILKTSQLFWWKMEAKRGKFCEKRKATVLCSAFESESYFQFGNLSRTHLINKKFRVVAMIDGKRSIGYVKGNLPPQKGTILKVLIRPNHPKKWIIDYEKQI